MHCWDAIVVGAGPAGCAAAYDLAIAGRSVLLLDKSEFPRPKACAGGLTLKSLRALRYSVDPVIRRWISTVVLERSPDSATTIKRRSPVCAMTVRQEFDNFCLNRTFGAGAAFQRIGPLQSISSEGDRICILAGEAQFYARFLVGADGVHSRVRQLTASDTSWFRRGFAIEANVNVANASAVPLAFDFFAAAGGYGWVFPRDTHVNMGLYTASAAAGDLNRERLHAYIESRFGAAPVTDVIGQYLGFGAGQYPSVETAIQPSRVILAGDAGGFADALTGEGIYGAIRSGQDAAIAILAAMGEPVTLQRAFAHATASLRRDLALSDSGARWFYSNLERGYRILTKPLLRRAVIAAYAKGSGLSDLATSVKHLFA